MSTATRHMFGAATKADPYRRRVLYRRAELSYVLPGLLTGQAYLVQGSDSARPERQSCALLLYNDTEGDCLDELAAQTARRQVQAVAGEYVPDVVHRVDEMCLQGTPLWGGSFFGHWQRNRNHGFVEPVALNQVLRLVSPPVNGPRTSTDPLWNKERRWVQVRLSDYTTNDPWTSVAPLATFYRMLSRRQPSGAPFSVHDSPDCRMRVTIDPARSLLFSRGGLRSHALLRLDFDDVARWMLWSLSSPDPYVPLVDWPRL